MDRGRWHSCECFGELVAFPGVQFILKMASKEDKTGEGYLLIAWGHRGLTAA